MSANNKETELKFLVNPKDLTKLQNLPWLKQLQVGRQTVKNLHAVYYDNDDHDLRNNYAALRIRREGRRYVQCLKRKASSADGAFTRKEWEAYVSRGKLDLAAFEDPTCLAALPVADTASLKPLFETKIKRTTRILSPEDGVEISFDLDHGEITSEDKSAPVSEVELELIKGPSTALYDIALKLCDDIPIKLSAQTKSDVGYGLAIDAQPRWLKAKRPTFPSGLSAEDALGTMVLSCLEQLRANEDCSIERTHIEGVHQMRVAARRLRSALSIYKKLLPVEQFNELNGELKWLINALGPARDWDVFVDETIEPMKKALFGGASLDLLEFYALQQRDLGYATVRRSIRSKRYTRLLIRLAQWVEGQEWRNQPLSENSSALLGPAINIAGPMLDKRHKRLLKDGKHFQDLDAETRHDLRIDVKKLRYVSDFFASLFEGKIADTYTRHLTGLQDGLGILNDVAVAQSLMADLVSSAERKDKVQLSKEAGMIIGWQAHVASQVMDGLTDSWKAFSKTKTFW